jgi:hypothetical protein
LLPEIVFPLLLTATGKADPILAMAFAGRFVPAALMLQLLIVLLSLPFGVTPSPVKRIVAVRLVVVPVDDPSIVQLVIVLLVAPFEMRNVEV